MRTRVTLGLEAIIMRATIGALVGLLVALALRPLLAAVAGVAAFYALLLIRPTTG